MCKTDQDNEFDLTTAFALQGLSDADASFRRLWMMVDAIVRDYGKNSDMDMEALEGLRSAIKADAVNVGAQRIIVETSGDIANGLQTIAKPNLH